MKKLNYNVYSSINDREYFKIEKKLNTLQYEMSKVLFPYNWRLPDSSDKRDGLYILFIKKENILHGNIGIVFEDQPGVATFYLAVLKYFEDNIYHYSLVKNLFENKEADFFKNNINELTKLALDTYNAWSKEYIVTFGEKDTLK